MPAQIGFTCPVQSYLQNLLLWMAFQPVSHRLCRGFVPTPLSHHIFYIKYILFKIVKKVKPYIFTPNDSGIYISSTEFTPSRPSIKVWTSTPLDLALTSKDMVALTISSLFFLDLLNSRLKNLKPLSFTADIKGVIYFLDSNSTYKS